MRIATWVTVAIASWMTVKASLAADWNRGVSVLDIDMPRSAQTYPVLEEPWQQMILREIRDKWPLVRKVIEETRRKILRGEIAYRPKAVHIPLAEETRIRKIVPEFATRVPIYDPYGNLLYPKGYKVRPLDYITLHRIYVVSDEEHIYTALPSALALAKRRNTSVSILLTKGDVIAVAREMRAKYGHQVQVFVALDELVKNRLGVERIPSIVYQEGHQLVVEEIGVK